LRRRRDRETESGSDGVKLMAAEGSEPKATAPGPGGAPSLGPSGAPSQPQQPLITLERVGIQFGGQRVLHEVDLAIRRAETVVVIGESGCGKTVLLKLIIGLLRPTTGRVTFDNRVMADLPDAELTRQRLRFGFLFQGAALFDSLSVFDNVAFGLRAQRKFGEAEVREKVRQHLQEVGLPAGVERKMPAELSGGMKKRVGLARGIVGEPQILLYDEPVTGLDPVNAAAVDRLIADIAERTHVTSIVVTHDVEGGLSISDRVALLEGGKLRFLGTPDEFRRSEDPLVRAFADRQAAVEAALAGSARSSRINDARTAALR
jgi:phospholipid/cholesterol/gamma-HCH transport system ATP-binding protein